MNGQELLNFKNWAVVGDVLNESKFAYKIVQRLESEGYNVVKVNPRANSNEVHKSLKEVAGQAEVIDLVIHPKVGINVMQEAKEAGIDKILIQPGAASEEILDYCKENSINVVESCVLQELDKRG